jgi:hypothetical protein
MTAIQNLYFVSDMKSVILKKIMHFSQFYCIKLKNIFVYLYPECFIRTISSQSQLTCGTLHALLKKLSRFSVNNVSNKYAIILCLLRRKTLLDSFLTLFFKLFKNCYKYICYKYFKKLLFSYNIMLCNICQAYK